MSDDLSPPHHLLLTERGENWLRNFDEVDRAVARNLVGSLALVSHNEFERHLTSTLLELSQTVAGPIALFGARELASDFHYGETNTSPIDATPRGSDIGSEGRMASMIRNLALDNPLKFLNHPTVEELRSKRADSIFILDDFIGSGKRLRTYMDALWQSRSLRSWVSYKRIEVNAVAYSATTAGLRHIKWHPSRPTTHIARHCPTISALHWKRADIDAARKLCRGYASRIGMQKWALGFRESESLLVFEHGCPNNAPAIFWATSKKANVEWAALFPAKRVDASIATAFPSEMGLRNPVHSLIEAGQRRLASALASNTQRPLTRQEALTLALFSKGQNRVETVANATGLPAKAARQLIEHCISAGWISMHQRITDLGRAELKGMSASSTRVERPIPHLGEDEYYPTALRGHGNG